MDYVYLTDLNSFISDEEIKANESCNCTLSSKNVLAISNDCCVYILPIEKPNELIPVTLGSSQTTFLVWSDDGQYLLNVYKNGACNLFSVKTNVLNSIELVYTFEIKKGDIAVVKPFSKSPKLCLSLEKKESMNHMEKFYYKSFNFLKSYGKFSYNGYLILTKSGILYVCITDYNSVKNRFEKFEYNMNLPKKGSNEDEDMVSYDLADFSFETDGSINIAFTDFDVLCPINIYKVNLKFSNDGLSIEGANELIASINLQNDLMTTKINFFFTNNESAQYFCVVLRSNQTNCDIIQFWQPSQLNQSLIGTFDMNTSNEQCILVKAIECPSSLIKVSVPKCAIAFKDFNDTRNSIETTYLLAAYQNGIIGFIDTQNFNQKFTTAIPINSDANYTGSFQNVSNKKIRFTQEYLVTLDQSFTGSIAVGITNFCRLALVRQPYLFKDQLSQNQFNHLMNLFEYSLLTGYDYWDLIISTHPKQIDYLIDRLEDKFLNQITPSMQRIYFNRYNCLFYSLYRKSLTHNQTKPLEILMKIILNRTMQILSYSVQLVLNVDSINSLLQTNSKTLNTGSLINNFETINQTMNNQSFQGIISQIPFRTNLGDYFSDILKVRPDINKANELLKLNDIINNIISRKNYQIQVNQQLKHILQWIVDSALFLICIISLTKNQGNGVNKSIPYHFGSYLINDVWFLNEIRKGLIYTKLIFVHSSSQNQSQTQAFSIFSSVPILPVKSSSPKDLIDEIFNIFSKLVAKANDRNEINSAFDDALVDQCLSIQNEIIKPQMDEFLFNIKHSWYGNNQWPKTLQFKVDDLFDYELNKKQYPLFDIIRLIQFSRSSLTKQCIRCGNFTESNSQSASSQANNPTSNSKINCILMQDACGDKCVCGGMWVVSM